MPELWLRGAKSKVEATTIACDSCTHDANCPIWNFKLLIETGPERFEIKRTAGYVEMKGIGPVIEAETKSAYFGFDASCGGAVAIKHSPV